MATNIEEIFRSFVVKKIKEIEDEKHQSGKVSNEANGEIKTEMEPKESEVVVATTEDTQEEQIVNNNENALSSLDEKQSDNPDNKENMTVDSITTEPVNCPALDNKEDSSTPSKKSKKHKHKHHHKSKKKKKKKKKKDDKKRDRERSRSKSQISLKSEPDLKLESQSKSHSKSPLRTECGNEESKNCSLLMESGSTELNKNTLETIDVNTVEPIGVEKECSVAEIKPLPQEKCNIDENAKENIADDTNNGIECATTGNVPELLAAVSACDQDEANRLIPDRSSDNLQSRSTQTIEDKNKHEQSEGKRAKRSRSRSPSKSIKHHKSQPHSHSQHSPVKKSCASSITRRHTSQSSSSRKRPSPTRQRSKSTSRERKKHTESSPKSKRKSSRSRSIAKKEQRSKSKSRSPLRIRHKSRSNSITRSKGQSKSRRYSRSCSRSKRRSRTRSGSPRRSKSGVKRSRSPRPRSRSNERVVRPSASRGYLSRLVRTRRSPDWRRRSRSPLRRKSNSRTPERLTDLDKAQLLEIAKANAAAMCAKAGMPLPANLKPVVPLIKKVISKKMGCSSIQEFTEKCKKIVESNDDNESGSKPRAPPEDEPFSNQPIKVNELKPISFSLNNATVKPAAKTQVALTKEFPVSSGSQHRKKEVLNVYGQWVPVEKSSKETTDDDVFPDVCTEAVDISTTMTERSTAQKRLVKNPYDVEAMSMILRTQEQIDVWAQANSLPGQFTGSTGAQVLTYEELTHSGPQAWIRKQVQKQDGTLGDIGWGLYHSLHGCLFLF
ncbi:protein SON isoform X2 [Amblyraja radiata]|uniref:protein SON isoform X2 n=1 Tax=Amblyraja radiata TaxID=386614 RepID=UPI001403B1D2|nr:protein SON isoform X2 [Amblyraja radiata]XP_032888439.1 protein SON isoform X2 [Amblyraja radiata]